MKTRFNAGFHIEHLPVCYPRLPQSSAEFQHPESDDYFMAATRLAEACEIIKGGCEGCQLLPACCDLFSALSDHGRDRKVKPNELIAFTIKFVALIEGK